MDHRQRGVAHVNIFWCLVPLVLMFAGIGYAYMKHTEADENLVARFKAERDSAAFKSRLYERERQLKDLTDVLGNPGKYKAPVEPIPEYQPPTQWTVPDTLENAFGMFRTNLGVPGSLRSLDDVLGAARTVLQERKDQIANLERSLTEMRNSTEQARRSLDQVRGQKDQEITDLQSQVRNEQGRIDRTVAQGQADLAAAREKTRQANKAREDAVRDADAQIKEKDRELRDLHAANQRKTDLTRLINSPQAPDGRVLSSSPSTRLAWIDIGAKDLVKVGLTFRVLEPGANGTLNVKGNAEVTKVENDRSEVKIVNLVNPLNPIVRNDLVANDLYSPNLKRNIYLLGRFGAPLTKGMITQILESMGNTVSEKMSPSVDLVIVGYEEVGEDAPKIADSEDFRKAMSWDIEVASLNKIRDFLKL